MNNLKKLTISCATAIAVLPATSQGASVQDGIAACVDALTVTLQQSHGNHVEVRAATQDEYLNTRMRDLEIFELQARGNGGNLVSRTECLVNRSSRVKRLRALPLSAARQAIKTTQQ